MPRILQRRRNRCLTCSVIVAAVLAFLVWDVLHFEAWQAGIPGPEYLVLWLGIMLIGLGAMGILLFEAIRFSMSHRKRRPVMVNEPAKTIVPELGEHEAHAAGQLVPRI